jgi:murein L,D-transpeptidase YcbB/YkuD
MLDKMILNLAIPRNVEGIYGNNRDHLPQRMRYLEIEAAISWDEHLADKVVVSDMFRSAEGSLRALRKGGAQRPGYSAHNYGLAVDLEVSRTMKKMGVKNKAELDAYMESVGWYCHRKDHKRNREEWHYNFLGLEGGYLDDENDKYRSAAIEQKILAENKDIFNMDDENARLLLAIKYPDYPELSKAIRKFQGDWWLEDDGILGPMTRRTLAYVTAYRVHWIEGEDGNYTPELQG